MIESWWYYLICYNFSQDVSCDIIMFNMLYYRSYLLINALKIVLMRKSLILYVLYQVSSYMSTSSCDQPLDLSMLGVGSPPQTISMFSILHLSNFMNASLYSLIPSTKCMNSRPKSVSLHYPRLAMYLLLFTLTLADFIFHY